MGTIAIQLGKHIGATVATTTSTANIDSLDEQTLKKSLRVLKPGGKLISISGPPDPAFARTSLIDAGIIRPVVDRIYPFESTKEAITYVESGRAKGRVVVKVA